MFTALALADLPESAGHVTPAEPQVRIHDVIPGALPAKRILVLEDDASFQDIMAAFLYDLGYDVVAVANGVEGVREVMKGEFEVILCDLNMPGLAGDMFFRAVERMRPHLRNRFVFMTGFQGNDKQNQFIKQVNGVVMTKPFHVDDMLEMFAFVQVRTMVMAEAA